MGELDGKAVVVTGAGRGLGRAYALALAAEGASVLVNDLDTAEGEAVAAEIAAAGGLAAAHVCSVADWDACAALVADCVARFGSIDGLVNNAGVSYEADVWDDTEAGIRATVEANMVGAIFAGTHALRAMREQGSGAIVNVTSGASLGLARMAPYGATKGGVTAITYTWAMEALPFGIRVNAISPVARTRMWRNPDHSPDEPEDIAPLVAYLLCARSGRITGQVIRMSDHELSTLVGARFPADPAHAERWTLDSIAAAFEAGMIERLSPVGIYGPTIDPPLAEPI